LNSLQAQLKVKKKGEEFEIVWLLVGRIRKSFGKSDTPLKKCLL